MSDAPAPIEQEPEADQTGANRFDVDVAKAAARKEMWRTIQKLFDNLGKIGGLLGLVLGGYATCAKADAGDTEQRLTEQREEIDESKAEIKEAKQATGLVLDYTTAVASSASAAVAAIASAAPPAPAITTAPPPAGSGGCWVQKAGGLVRCKPAPSSSSAAPPAPPRMASPAPPDIW